MASLTCQNCGATSGLTGIICPGCGALRPMSILLSVAPLALSWFGFSLCTINLVSFTLFEVKTTPTPEIVMVVETPEPPPTPDDSYTAPPVPEKPPEVYTQVYTPYATDNQGRTASFVIHLLTDDYRWMLGRSDMLENRQSEVSFSEPMKRLQNRAVEIICIGASSEEIEAGLSIDDGRTREEWRAAQRAESIARWVRAALYRPVNVRKLNIGHRDPANEQGSTSDTSDQRRVIIVLVLKMDEDTNMEQALRNAFLRERGKQPIYETILTRYSLTQGLRFHWVP
jgi:hypothetical protein